MFVEKSETLDLLMRDQRFLERSLQQSGLNLDKQGVEYSLMDQQQGQQQKMAHQDRDMYEQGFSSGEDLQADEEVVEPSILEPRGRGNYVASTGVNLVI